MESKTILIGIWKAIGPALIGALAVIAGIYINQHYFRENKTTEAGLALQKELVQLQYAYMNKLLRYVELGKALTHNNFITTYKNPDGTTLGQNTITVDLPSIAISPSIQSEWNIIAGEIANSKAVIDHDIYKQFEVIAAFAMQNPWPTENTLAAIEKSGWNKADIIGAWLQNNDYLQLKVENFLSLKK